jgi:hypothetical protein
MTTHRRDDEWLAANAADCFHGRADDPGNVRHAPAADTNRDSLADCDLSGQAMLDLANHRAVKINQNAVVQSLVDALQVRKGE